MDRNDARRRKASRPAVRAWRWRIAAGEPLPLHHAWTVANALRAMLIRENRRMFGHPHLPSCLHHSDDHSHAFYIPEPDEDGLIRRFSVFARGGLDRHALVLLCAATFLKVKMPTETRIVELEPECMGMDAPDFLAGPARTWCSATPFFPVHEYHQGRPHDMPEAQLEKAVTTWRGIAPRVRVRRIARPELPAPELFTPVSWRRPRATHKGRKIPPQARPAYYALEFDEPVRGPLLLGRGEHFGLGLFLPAEQCPGTPLESRQEED